MSKKPKKNIELSRRIPIDVVVSPCGKYCGETGDDGDNRACEYFDWDTEYEPALYTCRLFSKELKATRTFTAVKRCAECNQVFALNNKKGD